jgi:CheY-like chemotaxis protein
MMPTSSQPTTDVRTAVLVGFPKGLEEALSVILTSSLFSVHKVASAQEVIELWRSRRVDLVIASNRCSSDSVLELTDALGYPRETRVIVLLAGYDPEAERGYRTAGLRYVLTMPVTAEDLLRLGSSGPTSP